MPARRPGVRSGALREAGVTARDMQWVEPRRLEVAGHPLGDDVVVLDDEHLRHRLDCERAGAGREVSRCPGHHFFTSRSPAAHPYCSCRGDRGRVTESEHDELHRLRLDAERGRLLVECSPEIVVVLDDHGRVVASSRRARAALEGLSEGGDAATAARGRGSHARHDRGGRDEGRRCSPAAAARSPPTRSFEPAYPRPSPTSSAHRCRRACPPRNRCPDGR